MKSYQFKNAKLNETKLELPSQNISCILHHMQKYSTEHIEVRDIIS